MYKSRSDGSYEGQSRQRSRSNSDRKNPKYRSSSCKSLSDRFKDWAPVRMVATAEELRSRDNMVVERAKALAETMLSSQPSSVDASALPSHNKSGSMWTSPSIETGASVTTGRTLASRGMLLEKPIPGTCGTSGTFNKQNVTINVNSSVKRNTTNDDHEHYGQNSSYKRL